MFILTKRATDGTQTWHRIHGQTGDIDVARAWYRSTRTTDIFELNGTWSVISETKLESWREQHAREEKEIAKAKGAAA